MNREPQLLRYHICVAWKRNLQLHDLCLHSDTTLGEYLHSEAALLLLIILILCIKKKKQTYKSTHIVHPPIHPSSHPSSTTYPGRLAGTYCAYEQKVSWKRIFTLY